VISFVIPGEPVGKPRQTRQDKWMKRPCVLRYRKWEDGAQAAARAAGGVPADVAGIVVHAYLSMPASWPARKRKAMLGKPHRQTPDADNILKACMDSLLPKRDAQVSYVRLQKWWVSGPGYVEVTVHESAPGLRVEIESREGR